MMDERLAALISSLAYTHVFITDCTRIRAELQMGQVKFETLAAQAGPDPHLFGLDMNGELWAIGLPGGVWVKGWPQKPPA
jgi:hypothetical protein